MASNRRWRSVVWGDPKRVHNSNLSVPWRGLGRTRKTIGFSNPLLQTGKKRMMWTYRCGHQSYDDFLELRSSGIKRYERQLRKQFNSPQGANSSGPFNGLCRGLRMLGRLFGGKLDGTRKTNQSSLPQFHTTLQPENGAPPTTVNLTDSLYLLLCIPHRKYATKLIQSDLQHIRSDQAFFKLLRTATVAFKDVSERLYP